MADPTVNTALAFGLVAAAGACTSVGAGLALVANLENTRFLAVSMALSAGVMLYISLVEIFQKSVGAFAEGYCPPSPPHGRRHADEDAAGECAPAFAAATGSFFLGVSGVLLVHALTSNTGRQRLSHMLRRVEQACRSRGEGRGARERREVRMAATAPTFSDTAGLVPPATPDAAATDDNSDIETPAAGGNGSVQDPGAPHSCAPSERPHDASREEGAANRPSPGTRARAHTHTQDERGARALSHTHAGTHTHTHTHTHTQHAVVTGLTTQSLHRKGCSERGGRRGSVGRQGVAYRDVWEGRSS